MVAAIHTAASDLRWHHPPTCTSFRSCRLVNEWIVSRPPPIARQRNQTIADVTQLLEAHRSGDEQAAEALIVLIYDDLLTIARQQLARLRPGNTLDTTALVHEAYLKLVDPIRVEAEDRNHFLALAAGAMRQILVDHVRQRTALKRGGGSAHVTLERVQMGVEDQADTILAIDQALTRLSLRNPRLTRIFECRFFAGLTEEETASALNVSLRTIQRDFVKGKAFLRRELRSDGAVTER
jgi:RNA polymerase sigma factor (TIGR02999 family)